jgi:hypothetical protein
MVKKIALTLLLVSGLVSCKKNTENYAVMDFVETEHDFGTIQEGQKVETNFKFTNDSDVDLIISNAQGSCGCTVGEYPTSPVKPHEEGVIKVTFNSQGKHGKQQKSVTISANTKNKKELLQIFAEVQSANEVK